MVKFISVWLGGYGSSCRNSVLQKCRVILHTIDPYAPAVSWTLCIAGALCTGLPFFLHRMLALALVKMKYNWCCSGMNFVKLIGMDYKCVGQWGEWVEIKIKMSAIMALREIFFSQIANTIPLVKVKRISSILSYTIINIKNSYTMIRCELLNVKLFS